MRYRLRTLMIVLAMGPPLLAWAWLYRIPLAITLALILTACIIGAVLGRTLLWCVEGLLIATTSLVASFRRATRRGSRTDFAEAEFSLSSFASKGKDRRKQ